VKTTTKVKRLVKQVLEVNQLLSIPKDIPQLEDWANSISELMPDVTPEHLKFVISLMKLGLLPYNTFEGVQNIMRGLEETKEFHGLVTEENAYRLRRADYVLKSRESPLQTKPIKRLGIVHTRRALLTRSEHEHYNHSAYRKLVKRHGYKSAEARDFRAKYSIMPGYNLQRIYFNSKQKLILYKSVLFTLLHPFIDPAIVLSLVEKYPESFPLSTAIFDNPTLVNPVVQWKAGKTSKLQIFLANTDYGLETYRERTPGERRFL